MKLKSIIIMATLLGVSATIAIAQEPEATPDGTPPARTGSTSPMTGERLVDLVKSIDDKASNQGNTWQFTFQERPIILIYDEKADRMRMFSPIGPETALDAGLTRRMLQANFDSALDARYAVANNLIWGGIYSPPVATGPGSVYQRYRPGSQCRDFLRQLILIRPVHL